MAWVAPVAMAGAQIGSTVASGLFGNKAAKKASNIAAGQQRLDYYLGEREYEDNAPYRQAGGAAVNQLSQLMGLGPLPGTDRRSSKIRGNTDILDTFNRENPDAAVWTGYPSGATTYSTGGSTTGGGVTGGGQVLQDGTGGWSDKGGDPSRYDPASGGGGVDPRAQGQEDAMSYFYTDPGYEFRQEEGNKAILRNRTALGGRESGATMKALDRYSQGIASEEYGNYMNRLFNLAGYGQTANQNSASAVLGAQGMGQQAALAAGNARGSGYANTANSINSGINGLAQIYAMWNGGGFGQTPGINGGQGVPSGGGYNPGAGGPIWQGL